MAPKLNLKKQDSKQDKGNLGLAITIPDMDGLPKEFKPGDTLTTIRPIRSLLTMAFADDETVTARLEAADNAQWAAVLKSVNTNGMNPADAWQAYVDALANAPLVLADVSKVPTMDHVVIKGSEEALALHLSQKLDAKVDDALTAIVEAQRESDAGPITLEAHLRRVFTAQELASMPIIGTKSTGSVKNDRAPWGYGVPSRDDTWPDGTKMPIWNGPWDHHKYEVNGGTVTTYFVSSLVAQMPGKAHKAYLTVNQVRALRAKTLPTAPIDGVPMSEFKDLLALRTNDVDKLETIASDAAFEFGRRVRRMSDAIKLWQQKEVLAERFGNIDAPARQDIGALSLSVVETANMERARKPFQFKITRYVTNEKGERERDNTRSMPFSLGTFLRIDLRNRDKYSDTATPATLLAPAPRQKGKDKEEGGPKQEYPAINTSEGFRAVLRNVALFADTEDNFAAILRRVREPKDGGETASAIMEVQQMLTRLCKSPDVSRLAKEYNDRQAKAMADNATDAEKEAA